MTSPIQANQNSFARYEPFVDEAASDSKEEEKNDPATETNNKRIETLLSGTAVSIRMLPLIEIGLDLTPQNHGYTTLEGLRFLGIFKEKIPKKKNSIAKERFFGAEIFLFEGPKYRIKGRDGTVLAESKELDKDSKCKKTCRLSEKQFENSILSYLNGI